MQSLSDTSSSRPDASASVPEASRFSAPTRIVAAFGCVRSELNAEVSALGCRRVGVIADRGFHDAGLLEPLLSLIDGVHVPVCALIGEDPDVSEAERASLAAVEAGAEAILAVGGGSALCAAKAAAIRLHNPPPLDAYAGSGQLPRPPAPVIAIPTTAGSGSEVSNVVVLHDPRHTRHLIIRGHGYEPQVALLDGELLRTLPPRPLIAAALDALSHALESLWARGATRFTDAMALPAAADIFDALPWVLDGDDTARQRLMEASAMANLACGNSGLGLVHALTSAPDVHLPHGYQNGVLLPAVARFNHPALRPEVQELTARLTTLYARIGFADRFAAGELTNDSVEAMVSAALANPFRRNSCRIAEEDDLRAILSAVAV
jgi:alcohol dehydrogenase class IV